MGRDWGSNAAGHVVDLDPNTDATPATDSVYALDSWSPCGVLLSIPGVIEQSPMNPALDLYLAFALNSSPIRPGTQNPNTDVALDSDSSGLDSLHIRAHSGFGHIL
ncbi:hypothetical protein EVAR_40110_1 [Eumeta japonica]|uniref:Uncharacterized protein n=1 Tax=Eumeta variegata TaxID=151549 RepID=A0A4C1WBM4_EUMVA|nr:hypothetical protein EVAR_40110_1 [Eumeta japonica]